VLVISVSGALFLSMAFLLPVIKRAKDNKQEVLILLTNKKVQKNIEEQLKRTRWFISKYIKKFEAPQDMKSYQGEYDEMIGDHHGSAGGVGENIHAHTEKDLRGGQKEDK
jgi:type III secretory pathway component EscR